MAEVPGVNGDTGGKSARQELDTDRIAYLRKINKQTLEVLQQKRHTLEGLFSQKLDAGQSNQGVYHSDKGFSDDDDQGDSSDDETAWITAAKRERFGYCAWRVKRCLMKQGFHVAGTREDYGYRPWLVAPSPYQYMCAHMHTHTKKVILKLIAFEPQKICLSVS